MNSDSSKSKTHIEEEMRRVNKLQKVKGQFILSEWKCVNWANYSKKYTLFYKKKKASFKVKLTAAHPVNAVNSTAQLHLKRDNL